MNKLFLIALISINILSCKKDSENISIVLPTIAFINTSNITTNSIQVTGNLSNGNTTNFEMGLLYSKTNQNIQYNCSDCNIRNINGNQLGNFVVNLTFLDENTNYYARFYVSNGNGNYSYSSVFSFKTAPFLVFNSSIAKDIFPKSATLFATFLKNAEPSGSALGFCYSKSSNPNFTNSIVQKNFYEVSNDVSFELLDLEINTTYYVRPFYVINKQLTNYYYYGTEFSFKTVGGLGSSGCNIIFDKGSLSNGWRYFEVSPTDLYKSNWGCSGLSIITTSTDVGTGLENTNKILNSCSSTNTFAYACKNYVYNGYKDWFLPSRDEVMISAKSLIQMDIYYTTGTAASSSEYTSSQNYVVFNFKSTTPYTSFMNKSPGFNYACVPLRRY